MANSVLRRLPGFALLILAIPSSLLFESPVAAQSNSCIRAEGEWLDTLNGPGTSGITAGAGLLNGTTETVYSPAFVVTPDPNVVSFIAETTITTNQGLLVTNNVYLYNFVTGVGTAFGTINAGASTGRFAGATGVIYFNTIQTIGAFPNQSFKSTITGAVCLAR
jgi:hypothetical protein